MSIIDLLHETAIADTDLLRKNDALGDVFTVPREVDFAFDAAEKEQAEDFAQFINGKSYGRAEISEIQDGKFRVVVFIYMPITQRVVCSVSGFMLCLSRLFKVDYKGWGSVIQK